MFVVLVTVTRACAQQLPAQDHMHHACNGRVGLTAICSKPFEITNFPQSHAHTQGEAHDFHTAELGCCILPTSNLLVKGALSETIQERQKTRSQQ